MCAKKTLSESDLKLELVQVLFRHGARTPIPDELVVSDNPDESLYEPWGLGALTNKGKKQAYDLGTFLRDRYDNLLGRSYKSEDIYARSTHSERTKMSLQLLLAGLYPPTEQEVWNSKLKWSPVPYSYTPRELDVLLRSFDLPEYLDLMAKVYQSDEFSKKVDEFSDFLKGIQEKTGIIFEDNFLNALRLSGLIFSQEHMSLTLPEWYTPETKQTFFAIRECFFDGYGLTTEMKKFGIGPLIKTFVESMNLNRNFVNPRKIYLFSAHDDNLASFARAHSIRDFRYPEFGSGLILEKWTDCNDKVFVRLLIWRPDEKVSTLRLGEHEEFCPIDDYLKIVQPVIPTDDELDIFFSNAHYKEFKNIFFRDEAVKKL